MSTIYTFTAVARQLALSGVGAYVGGHCTHTPRSGAYDFSGMSALPGATLGAVLPPAAFHLVKPVVGAIASKGLRATGAQLPNLLRNGTFAAAPLARAALAGAVVGGSLTYEASQSSHINFSGLTVFPGAIAGVIAGPALLQGATMAFGRTGGAAAFLASGVGMLLLRKG